MSLLSSLSEYFPNNEGGSVDAVGLVAGNTLTNTNGVGSGTGSVYSNAADFESSLSQYFTGPDSASLSLGGNISFEGTVFVMLESYGSGGVAFILSKDDTILNKEYSLYYYQPDSKFYFECSDGLITRQVGSPAFAGGANFGQWYKIFFGRNAATNKIFIKIDAGTKNTADSTSTLNGTAPFQVGSRNGAFFWDGLIGPIGLHKGVVLSDDEEARIASGIPFESYGIVAPTITSAASVSVREADTSLATSITVNDGGEEPTYSIIGGVDAALFFFDGPDLNFSDIPDYEIPSDSDANNIYLVTVRATNSAGHDDQVITITVTNDPADDVVVSDPCPVYHVPLIANSDIANFVYNLQREQLL